MSDEPSQWKSPCPHPEAVGLRWGDPIPPERAAELRELADQHRVWVDSAPDGQRNVEQSVFTKVERLTGADAFWLAAYALAGLDGNFDEAEKKLRPALDGSIEVTVSPSSSVHLEGANLWEAHLEGAILGGAHLEGANLSMATLDKTTRLNDAILKGVSLDEVTFDNVNLAVVDWKVVPILGDELTATKRKHKDGKPKDAKTRRDEYAAAVRANRVLAVTLRSQGMNEDADRYAYRAQLCQRRVSWLQRQYLRYLGSLFLGLIAGYGYRPLRSFLAYGLVIIGFMLAYMQFGVVDASCTISGMSTTGSLLAMCSPSHTLTIQEAFVFSLTSFHGRGFFPGGLGLDSPITLVAAIEAVIGLLIEITFIATFTNRFFAR